MIHEKFANENLCELIIFYIRINAQCTVKMLSAVQVTFVCVGGGVSMCVWVDGFHISFLFTSGLPFMLLPSMIMWSVFNCCYDDQQLQT